MLHSKSKTIIFKDTKPFTLVECGCQKCNSLHSFGPAIRPYNLLHFVISGKGEFVTERGRHKIGENEMFIIRPFEITYYEADENEPWEYVWIAFNSEIKLPNALTDNDVIYAPFFRDIFLNAVSDGLFEDGADDGAYETYLCGLVMQLTGLLMRGAEHKRECAEDYVKRAIAIIEAEHHSQINATYLAHRLHLNRSYFSEIFREKTGFTPHKYLTDHRMKRAAELLTERKLSVSVTALSVGYQDVFVFSRAFKQYYGITPTRYAEINHKDG